MTLAGWLVWDLAHVYAPSISYFFICMVLANGTLYGGGNPAGLAVALCIVATWCFLRGQHTVLGIISLAIALTLKPHDTGMIWLFLMLAGGPSRRRSIQALVVAFLVAAFAAIWVAQYSPNWPQEMRANWKITAAPGSVNSPDPEVVRHQGAASIISLQSVFAVFGPNPTRYNISTYLVCGVLFGIWFFVTMRSHPGPERNFVSLAAIATLVAAPHLPPTP